VLLGWRQRRFVRKGELSGIQFSPVLEIVTECGSVRVPLVGSFAQAAAHDPSTDRWHVGAESRMGGTGAVRCLSIASIALVARPWNAAGEHLEENAAERVDVTARVASLALDLLRGHVVGCPEPVAEHLPCQAAGAVEQGDSKVGDHEPVTACDKDVGRLDVPVDDAVLVRVGQGVRKLDRKVDGSVEREAALAFEQRRSVSPSMYSMTRYGRLLSVLRSIDRWMPGWSRRLAIASSRRNRSNDLGLATAASWGSFRTT
jgi:hypothetical protein